MKEVLPEERRPLLFATLFFFFALAGYYVLRPLREEMGVRGGGEKLSLLFLGTLCGTFLLNPLLGKLMSKTTRVVFVPLVYRTIVASLVGFSLALRLAPEASRKAIAAAFFVWVSVFVLFLTALFWAVMVDVFRSEQAKRLFGFIGAGGTAGGIAGAALTAAAVKAVGPENMILLAALLLEIAVRCLRALVASVDPARTGAAERAAEAPPARGAWDGVRRVFASPYLLGICLFLLLFTISSTFLYFEQARIVKRAFASSAERTAFFARIDLAVNVLTVAVQVLLTSRVLRRLGVGATLALMPFVTVAGFALLWSRPWTATLFGVQTVRRALEYALIRPAREVLFTVVPREEKYASKSFIDTFVYRGGDAIGALVDITLTAARAGAGLALAAFLPIGLAWAFVASRLGSAQRERQLSVERAAAEPAGASPARTRTPAG